MSGLRKQVKFVRWRVVMVTVFAVLAPVELSVRAQALAATELVTRSASSATNSASVKSVEVRCPNQTRIVGGGGLVFEVDSVTNRLTLTRLEPVRQIDGVRDGYRVTAAETTPGVTGDWSVSAYARCANVGIEMVSAFSDPSSSSVKATVARCAGPGRIVLGTGARIGISRAGQGQVGLQVSRASRTGDIARAQAHEDANGYAGAWYVVSYAICAIPPPGYEVNNAPSPQNASESSKSAFAFCSNGKQLYGIGAATTKAAPGNVSLHSVFPGSDTGMQATAVENRPTPGGWDFIVGQAICAS